MAIFLGQRNICITIHLAGEPVIQLFIMQKMLGTSKPLNSVRECQSLIEPSIGYQSIFAMAVLENGLRITLTGHYRESVSGEHRCLFGPMVIIIIYV